LSRNSWVRNGLAIKCEVKFTLKSAGARRRLREVELCTAEQERLRKSVSRVPFLDDFDLRYRLQLKQPKPSNKAVMFCVMDVSGSMDQQRKNIAKRFFILLYLFLQRNYEKTEVVFIRHHASALVLVDEIIQARYPPSQWNL
jgi:uncharacterized sporulation protein YeaH/YhbH (DUF444 family)